jgi:hypothetical protein
VIVASRPSLSIINRQLSINFMLLALPEFLTDFSWHRILLGAGLFLASFIASIIMVSFVLVRLPADYFHPDHAREFMSDKPWAVRWGGLIVKNVVGFILIVLGIVMSLPGVPGQGILTILLGLLMMDIPGKRPWETRIVRRPSVLSKINALREKFGKPPLILE